MMLIEGFPNVACIESAWYQDADDDGLGNPDVSQMACDQPDGYVADNSDTDEMIQEVHLLHVIQQEKMLNLPILK